MGLAAIAPVASAGLGLIGGIMGAQGAQQQAAATSASDLYQAQVAQNNAQIAKENAKATFDAGDISAQDSALQDKAKTGTMVAGMGANGVDVNTGSNAAVRAGSASNTMLDALTIRSNAARQAYGYQVQQTSDQAQAGLDTMSAANATQAGQIAADTSLLSGATSVARSFAPYQNASGIGTGNFGLPNIGTG